MMEHRTVRASLYDYARGEADGALLAAIERHLAGCARCREELDGLKAVIALTPGPRRSPSEERGEEFWRAFPFAVEKALGEKKSTSLSAMLREFARPLFLYRRRSAALLAAGLALGIVAGIMLTRREAPPQQDVAAVTPGSTEVPVVEVDRMQRYFRKSKMLLVGIENMKTSPDGPVDLAVERNASRELLQEARYLRYQPLDSRSAKLIDDLEKILIELSTIKEEKGLPNVEILRGGIHQENLLFKIRMAEAMFDTTKFMKSTYYH